MWLTPMHMSVSCMCSVCMCVYVCVLYVCALCAYCVFVVCALCVIWVLLLKKKEETKGAKPKMDARADAHAFVVVRGRSW